MVGLDSFDTGYKHNIDEAINDANNISGKNISDNFKFIEGDILKTLLNKSNVPDKISVLRLDTDWYESTKIELEVLYPKLQKGGVILIDDYGHWGGCKKAVDEYFSKMQNKPLFIPSDYTGRVAVKT